MSWYSEGFQGADEAVKQAQERRTHGLYRFYLRPGETKIVSFIDDRAFSFMEHNYQRNGKWGNYATCIGIQNGCPFCLGDNRAYRVTVFTIVDHTVFKDRQGVEKSDTKRILAAKEDQSLILRNNMQKWGGLKAKRVVISRGAKKQSPAWGESFSLDFENGQVVNTDWSRYPEGFLVPEQYESAFAMKSKAELDALYNQSSFSSNAGMPVSTGYGQQPAYGNQGYAQGYAQAPAQQVANGFPPNQQQPPQQQPQQPVQQAAPGQMPDEEIPF